MAKKKKTAPLWKKLTLLGATLAFCLLMSEGIVRLRFPEYGIPVYTTKLFTEFDPMLGWRKIPNFRGKHVQDEYTIFEHINSKGLRGPEFPYEKPEDKYRILVLGDSFAEGYTVEFADLFSEVLREKLADKLPQDIDVINAGTGGYSTDQELLFFQHEGKKYHPDLTILLFFSNDLPFNIRDYYAPFGRGQKPLFELKDGELSLKSSPVATWDRDKMQAEDEAEHAVESSFPWTLDSWYLYRLSNHVLTARTENVIDQLPAVSVKEASNSSNKENTDAKLQISNDEQRREWEMTEALLAKLQAETKTSGSEFLLFYVPVKREVYRKNRRVVSRASTIERNLKIVATRNEIDLLQTTAIFQAQAKSLANSKKYLYWQEDAHWTAEGNHLAGLILAEHIEKNAQQYNLTKKD